PFRSGARGRPASARAATPAAAPALLPTRWRSPPSPPASAHWSDCRPTSGSSLAHRKRLLAARRRVPPGWIAVRTRPSRPPRRRGSTPGIGSPVRADAPLPRLIHIPPDPRIHHVGQGAVIVVRIEVQLILGIKEPSEEPLTREIAPQRIRRQRRIPTAAEIRPALVW